MPAGIERKYIILFAILIALTGFTFESQKSKAPGSLDSSLDSMQTASQAGDVLSANSDNYIKP